MKKILVSCLFILMFPLVGCVSVNHSHVYMSEDGKPSSTKLSYEEQERIDGLYKALLALSPEIDESEAMSVAYDAVVYPLILANKWGSVYPPQYNNVLVNTGKLPRGLCYQWAEDMTKHMAKKNLKSFDLHHGMAFRWTKEEHNTLIISAKGDRLKNGIVLDPWRFSGVLYWSKVADDKTHPWVAFK